MTVCNVADRGEECIHESAVQSKKHDVAVRSIEHKTAKHKLTAQIVDKDQCKSGLKRKKSQKSTSLKKIKPCIQESMRKIGNLFLINVNIEFNYNVL